MTRGEKLRVAVIYGGRSSEHDVSLESAAHVIANLDAERYEIIPISIDPDGVWQLQDLKRLLASGRKALPLPTDSPSVQMATGPSNRILAGSDAPEVDLVFAVMHGPLCEDGAIQGLMDLADVPYVGSGVLGSAICMDKDVAKRLVAAEGIGTVPYQCFRRETWQKAGRSLASRIDDGLGYPLFVKPANMGSSVGISRATRADELTAAVEEALRYDDKVIVEQAVDAREIEVAVLAGPRAGAPAEASLPGEIIAVDGFYSFDRKYLDADGADLHVPADLTTEQTRAARETACRIFEILQCEGMARIDFFLERTSGRLLFNEANTIPGFTNISMYPKLWEASGLPYAELLTRLVEDGLRRGKRRQKLQRTRR